MCIRDRVYNERFNCFVRPHYDGSAQTFPGLSFEHFAYKELYPCLLYTSGHTSLEEVDAVVLSLFEGIESTAEPTLFFVKQPFVA